MKKFVLFIFLFGITWLLAAQSRKCGTGLIKVPSASARTTPYPAVSAATPTNPVSGILTIPVVVHIISNPDMPYITDEQVYSQIEVLNEDFRKKWGTDGYNTNPVGVDVEIEFQLADRDPEGAISSGITRTSYNKKNWTILNDSFLKSLSYWPSDQYLNIWVTSVSSDYMAWSQFPQVSSYQGLVPPYGAETDGVVIDYKYFGRTGTAIYPYDLGRSATHEIGHWLGLLHIWGDSDCGDDYVADTPQDMAPNYSGTCIDSSDCNNDGKYTRDMASNYLDYSDDACMHVFTQGQKDRMRNVFKLNARRNALLSSPAITATRNLVAENVIVSPNPASRQVTINFFSSHSGSATLVNELSIPVSSMSFVASKQVSVPLTTIPSGIYFLMVETEKGKLLRKIVKQ